MLRSSTRVGLSYSDVTRTQSLQFSTAGAYEIDSDGETDVSDPFAQLAYALNGANSRLSFSANYRRTDLDNVFVPLELGTADGDVISTIAEIDIFKKKVMIKNTGSAGCGSFQRCSA